LWGALQADFQHARYCSEPVWRWIPQPPVTYRR
jgi:hypothetical protein